MTASRQAPAANARGWREWARDNRIGLNAAQRAIASGKLKVRRHGKKMLVLHEDGIAFLRALPEGPGPRPKNFEKDAT
jgi:hypothetical protein